MVQIPFIDDFYVATRDNGDYLRAFNDAQDALTTLASTDNPFSFSRGATLAFRPTVYPFSDTLHVRRPMHLMGSGSSYKNGTMLQFPPGKRGVIIHGANTSKYKEFGGNPLMPESEAEGSIIERLLIGSTDKSSLTNFRESYVTPYDAPHGVTVYSRCHLRDMTITGFAGHGIYIFGFANNPVNSAATDTVTHPALSLFSNVNVTWCSGNGVHIIGSDASHMQFNACMIQLCGGFGICDKSTLGNNTFITGQSSDNALGAIQRPFFNYATDYQTLAHRSRYQIDRLEDGEYKSAYLAVESILLGMGEAGIENALFVNPTAFAGLESPVQLNSVEYVTDYLAFIIAKFIKHQELGTLLNEAAKPFIPDFSNETLLEQLSPTASGGDVFISVYAEGANNWQTYFETANSKPQLLH
jgi:hypothetical protein